MFSVYLVVFGQTKGQSGPNTKRLAVPIARGRRKYVDALSLCVKGRGGFLAPDLMADQAIEGDVGVSDQRDDEGNLNARTVTNEPG